MVIGSKSIASLVLYALSVAGRSGLYGRGARATSSGLIGGADGGADLNRAFKFSANRNQQTTADAD